MYKIAGPMTRKNGKSGSSAGVVGGETLCQVSVATMSNVRLDRVPKEQKVVNESIDLVAVVLATVEHALNLVG